MMMMMMMMMTMMMMIVQCLEGSEVRETQLVAMNLKTWMSHNFIQPNMATKSWTKNTSCATPPKMNECPPMKGTILK